MKCLLLLNFLWFFLGCCFSNVIEAQGNDLMAKPSTNVLEQTTQGWISIQGDSITVWCLPEANIKKLEARLRTRDVPMNRQYRMLLSNRSLSMEDRLKARLEIILLRVKEILAMDPKDFHVKVRIFKTREDMNQAYQGMFNEPANFKSFYMHHFRSIYTDEQDFLDSVIAHELGHAVIDHYFAIPPPSKMAEMMATYVDAHLERD